MRQSPTRAALIYLHGSDQRQHEIAQALSNLADAELRTPRRASKAAPRGSHRARSGHAASGRLHEMVAE
jgi:hypothetical protein